jgi:hypothetical protein
MSFLNYALLLALFNPNPNPNFNVRRKIMVCRVMVIVLTILLMALLLKSWRALILRLLPKRIVAMMLLKKIEMAALCIFAHTLPHESLQEDKTPRQLY